MSENYTLKAVCPHCQAPFDDSSDDGGMARLCSACNKWFFGYCYKPCLNVANSRSPLRVEKRKMNLNEIVAPSSSAMQLTNKGSKRTKKGSGNNDSQDASIFKIQEDLAGLGIDRGEPTAHREQHYKDFQNTAG